MFDYASLSAVGAVIREGSFERAAAVLGMTPSAVSQRVRGLEERLGAILVVRDQPCRATDLGRTLCAHLDRVRLLEAELAPHLTGGDAEASSRIPIKIAVNADSLATWFTRAAVAFGDRTGTPLDITLDDEAHTAERLRTGEVLAAVTADTRAVQGCRTFPLGALQYAACASPAFAARFFADGVDAKALANAPSLRFDRRDQLQARWAAETLGLAFEAPTYWVPSTPAFLDFALAGVGWGMQPVELAQAHIAAGRLVELVPARRIAVQLHWTVARLPVAALHHLTDAVRTAAAKMLLPA